MSKYNSQSTDLDRLRQGIQQPSHPQQEVVAAATRRMHIVAIGCVESLSKRHPGCFDGADMGEWDCSVMIGELVAATALLECEEQLSKAIKDDLLKMLYIEFASFIEQGCLTPTGFMESNTERMLKPKIKRKVDRKEVMDAFSDCFMSVERTIRRTNDKDGDILFFSVGEWIARRSLEEKHADDLELIFDIGALACSGVHQWWEQTDLPASSATSEWVSPMKGASFHGS